MSNKEMLMPLLAFCFRAHTVCLRAYLVLRGACAGLRVPQFCLRHTLTRGPLLNMKTRVWNVAQMVIHALSSVSTASNPAGVNCHVWQGQLPRVVGSATRSHKNCSCLSRNSKAETNLYLIILMCARLGKFARVLWTGALVLQMWATSLWMCWSISRYFLVRDVKK